MNRCLVPAQPTRTEITVVNSLFIATLGPAFTVDSAKGFIAKIKTEFPDASHNVPAFVIGHGLSVIAHCNDDGEPSGTAGRPALAVLQGSGLGDAVVVVTRFFGGTKLGKGGLVRAYGDAVREVLKQTPLAEKVPTHLIMIAIPYSLFERVRLLIAEHHGKITNEDFGADVTITCQFTVKSFPGFQMAVSNLTHGSINPMVIETDQATIMPISKAS